MKVTEHSLPPVASYTQVGYRTGLTREKEDEMLSLKSIKTQAIALTLAAKEALSGVLGAGVAALKLSGCHQAANRELRYKTRSLPW